MSHIYILKNKINNKLYVGQTTNLHKRFILHKLALTKQVIHKAIQKYGWGNFNKFYFWCPEILLDFLKNFSLNF